MAKNKKKLAEKVTVRKSDKKKKTVNPFEIHINKQKYQVLGQKGRNDRGLPGVSRAKALKKRKRTLLPEYNVKNKTNKFLDRRIGEKNFHMTEEDRTMARFTAERLKHHNKKSIFNLADDEILTHRGQTLNEIEKFDDPRSDDDDDEEEDRRKNSGKLDNAFVGDAHFGGGILKKTNKDGTKSYKDLIDQLIVESKKRKAEKQKTKEHTLELTEKLDSEWKDLLPLVNKCKKTEADKLQNEREKPDDYDKVMRELRFEARGNPTDRLKSEDEIAREEKEKLEKLELDRLNRMQGFTATTNKTKHRSADDLDDNFNYDSDPEVTLAYDEGKLKNNLEELTSDFNGDVQEKNVSSESEVEEEEGSEAETDDDLSDLRQDESDSDLEESVKHEEINKTTKTSKPAEEKTTSNKNEQNINLVESVTGTSSNLEDSIIDEEINKNTKKIKLVDEKNTSLKNERKIKQVEPVAGTALDLEDVIKNEEINKTTKTNKPIDEKITFLKNERKRKLDEFVKDPTEVKNQKIDQDQIKNEEINLINEDAINEIMEKAKKELPYTYKLPDSYETLQTLLANQAPEYQDVIIDRMIKCNHPSLGTGNKEKLGQLFVYLLQHLNDVAPESTDTDTENVKHCFSVVNSLMPHLFSLTQLNPQNTRDSLIEVINEKQNEYKKTPKTYPGLDVLVFLKVISCLFSTSDFRHQLVTPSLVFMNQMLTNCRIKTSYDMAYGLFLVTLFVEYTTLSKRFMPSAIIYLMGIIHMAVPKFGIRLIKVLRPFKSNSAALVLPTQHCQNIDDFKMCANDFVCDKEIDEEFKIRILFTSLKLAEELYQNWTNLSMHVVIFEPFFKLLEMVPKENYPKKIEEKIVHLQTIYSNSKENQKIEYIVHAKKKPKALRLYEPNIQKVYDGKRFKPMSKEKAEREKLLHKYKKEMKGALREIRHDKSFLGRVKIKQQIQSDMDRKEKVKQIYAEASIQQSELNELDRKKKRK